MTVLILTMVLCLNGECREVNQHLPPDVSFMACMLGGQSAAVKHIQDYGLDPNTQVSRITCEIRDYSDLEA